MCISMHKHRALSRCASLCIHAPYSPVNSRVSYKYITSLTQSMKFNEKIEHTQKLMNIYVLSTQPKMKEKMKNKKQIGTKNHCAL